MKVPIIVLVYSCSNVLKTFTNTKIYLSRALLQLPHRVHRHTYVDVLGMCCILSPSVYYVARQFYQRNY